MICIKKDFANPPAQLDTTERMNLIKLTLTQKGKHSFKKKVYRDGTLAALEKLYHGKCAYCETDTRAGAPMQVEHYRPKAKVTEDDTHEGYYWIGYEWSNLLLSCAKCNNAKRNRFPIAGTRFSAPTLTQEGLPDNASRLADSQVFQGEKPLLLHPEIDKIESFFVFLPNGKIEVIEGNERALETIRICGLNRKDLVEKRLKILNSFFDRLQKELKDLDAQVITVVQARHAIKRIFEELALLQSPQNEYSRFGYFMFFKFDKFFSERFAPKQQQAIKALFALFKTGNL